ncbi:MAG: hypothetical protein WC505_01970 [Patescibacteria group bacterium]
MAFRTGLRIALKSAASFPSMAVRCLRLRRGRIGRMYDIKNASAYSVFRETANKNPLDGQPTVLVVGFRLKLAGQMSLLHWLFQRVCIVTTPFWSGLPGFGVKLWMVDPAGKKYLGVYEWHGTERAQAYVRFLLPVLNFFSVHGSVWHRMHENTRLEAYLQQGSRQ